MGDQLGLPGTPAADILSKLGKPDEMTPSLEHGQVSIQTMPGKRREREEIHAHGCISFDFRSSDSRVRIYC